MPAAIALLTAALVRGPMMLRSEVELELQPKATNANVNNPRNFRMSEPPVVQVVGSIWFNPLVDLPWPPANKGHSRWLFV